MLLRAHEKTLQYEFAGVQDSELQFVQQQTQAPPTIDMILGTLFASGNQDL